MNKNKALLILNESQAQGAGEEIDLKLVSNASLENAKRANLEWDYKSAANLYYTIFTKEKNSFAKAKYAISLSQELINASSIKRAKEILGKVKNLCTKLQGDDKKEILAAYHEKMGWVYDLEEKPLKEKLSLEKAKEILGTINTRRKKEIARGLTIDHFIGRAIYKNLKAGNSKNNTSDLNVAEEIFTKNMAEYEKRKEWASVAFNFAWLARVEIERNNLSKASRLVAKAKTYFKKSMSEEKSSSKITSHYHRVAGLLEIAKGDSEEAFRHAVEAFRLTLPPGIYYNGTMEAVKIMVESSFV